MISVGSSPFYYLFANPSFLSGIARVLDLGGHYDAYNFSVTSEQADIGELSDDWRRIYKALTISWIKLARENEEFVHELGDVMMVTGSTDALSALELLKETDELEEATSAR